MELLSSYVMQDDAGVNQHMEEHPRSLGRRMAPNYRQAF